MSTSKTYCDGKCLGLAQKSLEKIGIALDRSLSVNFTTGKARMIGPFLKVHWLGKPKRGKSLPSVMPMFCPWCGQIANKPRTKKGKAAKSTAKK